MGLLFPKTSFGKVGTYATDSSNVSVIEESYASLKEDVDVKREG